MDFIQIGSIQSQGLQLQIELVAFFGSLAAASASVTPGMVAVSGRGSKLIDCTIACALGVSCFRQNPFGPHRISRDLYPLGIGQQHEIGQVTRQRQGDRCDATSCQSRPLQARIPTRADRTSRKSRPANVVPMSSGCRTMRTSGSTDFAGNGVRRLPERGNRTLSKLKQRKYRGRLSACEQAARDRPACTPANAANNSVTASTSSTAIVETVMTTAHKPAATTSAFCHQCPRCGQANAAINNSSTQVIACRSACDNNPLEPAATQAAAMPAAAAKISAWLAATEATASSLGATATVGFTRVLVRGDASAGAEGLGIRD